jgi:L-seryl-tRNA(Ser) seleniumtransferase
VNERVAAGGLLRAIPPMSELLVHPAVVQLAARTSYEYARERLRAAVDELRVELARGTVELGTGDLLDSILSRLACAPRRANLRRVVNATGVVLHTNLGRAPLSQRAVEAVARIAASYSNLEYDVEAGRRGSRDVHGEDLLCEVLGCEAAVVANNNAAAVMLVLNTLASGGEVPVSRGELVEIGGGFRIPEVLERSGCRLREVGTTNRTRISDYERAIGPDTRALLRVHPSNYRIIGFTGRPTRAELVALGRRTNLPVVEDLGSGCLVPLGAVGILDEPLCGDVVADGVDLVTFSGDKLLGGPQAGIVAGRRALVEAVRRNPLMRALRVDKMVYAALEATLLSYIEGRADEEVPAIRMLRLSAAVIEERATRLASSVDGRAGLRATVVRGSSVAGAGSAPASELETVLLAVAADWGGAERLASRLRDTDPPVIGRVEHDRVMLDLRTVEPADDGTVADALIRARPGD